jgi:hypothetical protein
MRAILQALADGTGLPMPRLRVPSGLILAAAASSTLVRRQRLRDRPAARRDHLARLTGAP